LNFSESEKDELLSSLSVICDNLDFFLIRFYYHFLTTKACKSVQNITSENNYLRMSIFLNFIITHIENRVLVKEYLITSQYNHSEYSVLNMQTKYFIDSFLNALKELFLSEKYENLLNLWDQELRDFMSILKSEKKTCE